MGEAKLIDWVAQVGLVLNRSSDQDSTGWDFLLEWPLPESAGSNVISFPSDKQAPSIQCFVQVKATDGRSHRRAVKLSNWVRLVRSPMPAFFVVLEYDGANDCQRAYLVHVGEDYTRRILKRLRELSAKSHADPELHRYSLTLTWTEADRLPSLDGAALMKGIESHIVDGMSSYAERKLKLLHSVGYEHFQRTTKVVFRVPANKDPDELLVDFLLGTVPSLEIESGEVRDTRFGISLLTSESIPAGTQLAVQPKSIGRGWLRFSAKDIRRELHIPAEVYVPHGAGRFIPDDKLKVRFAAEFLDIVFNPATTRFSLKLQIPDVGEMVPLDSLQKAADLLLFMHEAHSAGSTSKLEVGVDSDRVGSASVAEMNPPAQPLVEWASFVKRAWVIARHFEIDKELHVKVDELAAQSDHLLLMASVYGPDPVYVKATFWLKATQPDLSQLFCFPVFSRVKLGDRTIFLSAAAVGPAVPTGQVDGKQREYVITTTDVRRWKEHVHLSSEKATYTYKDLLGEIVAAYDKDMNVVVPKTRS